MLCCPAATPLLAACTSGEEPTPDKEGVRESRSDRATRRAQERADRAPTALPATLVPPVPTALPVVVTPVPEPTFTPIPTSIPLPTPTHTPAPTPLPTPVPNNLPVANAAVAFSGRTNRPVVLSGTGSTDLDGDQLSFTWSIESSPPGSSPSLTSATEPVGFLTGDQEGEYSVALVVQDDRGGLDRALVTVNLDADGDGLIGSDDPDRDGDRVPNGDDAFPDDPGEFLDWDADGVGNFANQDEDRDGVPDVKDFLPFDPRSSRYLETAETEFNDNPTQADLTGATYPLRVSGAIQQDIDGDYFRFTAIGEDFITAVLTKMDPEFNPVLTLANERGVTLQEISPFISQNSAIGVAVSALIPADGEYFVIVNDFNSRGAPGFNYTVDIFKDLDLDALDDERERALGVNNRLPDSDGDGIFDAAEVNTFDRQGGFVPDSDGDGVPNWLDFDADGDGIHDEIEGSLDPDGDGLGNFVDTDSDGNGVTDEIEVGLNPTRPQDTDSDGVPDFRDIDDDNDGILDVFDTDRLVAVTQSDVLSADPAQRLVLNSAKVEFGDGAEIKGLARPGDTLLLDGSGFSNDPGDNLVIFADASGFMLNLRPALASATRLEIQVPEITFARVAVVVGNLRSNWLEVRIVESDRPILFPRFPFSGSIGSTVTLEGLNLAESTVVNFEGVRATPFNITATSVDVTVPSVANSGILTVDTATGISNGIRFKVTRGIPARVTLPPGVDVEMASLTVTFGVLGEATPDGAGEVSIETNISGLDFIYVLLPASGANPVSVMLQAVVLPDDQSVSVDSLSTATAMAIQGAELGERVHPRSLAEVMGLVRELPEVQELANAIATGLAADPYFLNSLPSAFFRTSVDATLATERLIESGLAINQFEPTANLQAKRASLTAGHATGVARAQGLLGASLADSLSQAIAGALEPTITPEQHDISVFHVGDSGNIGIENDTQLYLSVKIIDDSTGAVLFPHITTYFDGHIVGTQGLGLLFWATSKDDFNQPRFKDATVEVVTPGAKPPLGPEAVRRYLALRTVVDQIILPLINQAVGDFFDASTFTKIIVDEGHVLVNTFGTYMDNGDAGQAVKSLAVGILDDAISVPPGPITQAVAKEVGEKFLREALATLAAKISSKFVPVVGQVLAAIEVISAASTFGIVGVAITDLIKTPSLLEFEVRWGLKVTGVSPGVVARKDEDKVFTITGQGFTPIKVGWGRRTTIEPRVLITDEGRAGDEPFRIKPSNINSEGTTIQVEVPWFYMGDVRGPLSVKVVFQGLESEAPNKIEVANELRVDSLNSDRGKSGDEVEIIGAGFSENRLENQVFFDGGGGENLTATVLTSSETTLLVVAPQGTKTGQVFVKVGNDVSDGLLFTVTTQEIRINFGDNGRLNDDTFALFVDDKLIHSMPAPTRDTGSFAIELEEGTHTVTLRGITAPDDVGTYYINFEGEIFSVEGDSLSGEDLNAGTEKHYRIVVGSGTSTARSNPTPTPIPGPTATPCSRAA